MNTLNIDSPVVSAPKRHHVKRTAQRPAAQDQFLFDLNYLEQAPADIIVTDCAKTYNENKLETVDQSDKGEMKQTPLTPFSMPQNIPTHLSRSTGSEFAQGNGPKAPTIPSGVDHASFLKEQANCLQDAPTPITKPFRPAIHAKVKRTFKYHPACFAKLIGFDLEQFLLDARLCPEAEAYIREAYAAPSRHLSGYRSHTIHYPVIRFGKSLKFESRDMEYPFGLMTIYRPDVYLVLEQPPRIKVTYPGGWSVYTPDLLVITATGVEIWETRHTEKLGSDCIKKPHLYQEVRGVYQAPLFQAFFAKWGFKYAIATEHTIHPAFCKAVEFLHPYIQGTPRQPITQEERDLFISYARDHSGVRLSEIPFEDHTRRTELALYLLATAKVFTTLSDADFNNPTAMRIYATAQDERAFHQYLQHARPRPADLTELGYRLKQGALIEIGDLDYKVTALTKAQVRLETEDGKILELSPRALLDLKPRIGRIYNAEKKFELLLQDAPMAHRLTHAARKLKIQPYLLGGDKYGERPTDHTIRRWLRAFEAAEAKGLCGDEAIFPKFYRSGREKAELPPDVSAELERLTKEHYLNPKRCTVQWVWDLLLSKFGAERLPSIETIYRRVGDLDPHQSALRRGGKRIGVATQSNYGDSPIWGSPHGIKSFQKAHIDSTPIDLRLEEEERHYLARMVDPFDGLILAEVLTAEAPSELTIRALLLECVRRHGALPSYISCDFGSEHRTVWLQESLSALDVILDIRPKSDPAKGGPVESSFSALCKELIHNLEGNTHLMKRARMVTKACNPDQFAIWTSVALRETITEYVKLRNDVPRSGKASPNDIAAACQEKYGPPPRNMPTVEDLETLLLPFVDRETRTVSKRGTVKVNGKRYGIRGERNILRRFAGRDLKVREVPENSNLVYVFAESPRIAIRCVCLACTGPSSDILDRANEIEQQRNDAAVAAGTPIPTPAERQAGLTAKVVRKEDALKVRKARKHKLARKARADGATDDPDTASDANIPATIIY